MNKYLVYGAVALALASGGYLLGRYLSPAKVIEKEKIKIVKEIEIKEVIKEVKVEKKDKNTKTTITEKPDGTKETVIVEVDKTVTDTNTDINKDTKDTTVIEKSKEKITINKKPDWRVTGTIGVEFDNYTSPIYGGSIEKRVFGPIFVGGQYINTDGKYFGFNLTWEF